jgi:hypothetical protein
MEDRFGKVNRVWVMDRGRSVLRTSLGLTPRGVGM